MLKVKSTFSLLIVLLFLVAPVFSQTKKEVELTKTADKLFEDNKFSEAEKIYSQLLSSNNENPEFNYKYGACLLKTSDKKTDAIKYLEFAVSKANEIDESSYYLARAYHVSYQFDKAITLYNKFKTSLKEKELKKYDLDLYIKECEVGKVLIKDFRQVKVIDAKKMRRIQFYRGYKLGKLGSKILIKPADFEMKEDGASKSEDPQLIVNGPEDDVLFFTGYKYGNKFGKVDLDIYMVEKTEDGSWSEIKDLGPFINTDFDDAYPYLDPSGLTLYFSSKGHDGLGGYDLYKSQLDTVTNLWGKPINLGFSINSPFDDILYVVDPEGSAAFFSSDRQNKDGEITVYKIIPPKKEDNFVLVKGDVQVEGVNNNYTKIDVVSSLTGEFIARYESNRKTGRFIFPLAELESFELEFTFADSLKQKVKLTTPSKKTKDVVYQHVKIKVPSDPSQDAFLEINEDPTYTSTDEDKLAAYDQLAALEENQVNDVKFAPNSTKKKSRRRPKTTMVVEESAPEIQTPSELLSSAQQELAKLEDDKKHISQQVNSAYIMAEVKNTKAAKLQQELDVLIAKSADLNEIEKKQVELINTIEEAQSSIDYAVNQESNYKVKIKEEQLLESYVSALELANSSGNSDAAISKLIQHQKEMEKIEQDLSKINKEDNIDQLKKDISSTKNDRSTVEKKLTKQKSDLTLMEEERKLLNQQIESTRKKSLKEELSLQLSELKAESDNKKSEVLVTEKQLQGVEKTLAKMAEQLSLFDEIESSASDPNTPIANFEKRKSISEAVKLSVDNKSKIDEELALGNGSGLKTLSSSDVSSNNEELTLGGNSNNVDGLRNNSSQLDEKKKEGAIDNNSKNNSNKNNSGSEHELTINTDQEIGEVKNAAQISSASSYKLIATNLGNLSDEELKVLSQQIFEYPQSPIQDDLNSSTQDNRKIAQEKLNQALAIQQIIEKKKKELIAVDNLNEKKAIDSQLVSLTKQLVSLKNESVEAERKTNNEIYNTKKEKLELALFVDPSIEDSNIESLRVQINQLWTESKQLSEVKKTSTNHSEIDVLGKRILEKEIETLILQNRLESLIASKSNTEAGQIAVIDNNSKTKNVKNTGNNTNSTEINIDNNLVTSNQKLNQQNSNKKEVEGSSGSEINENSKNSITAKSNSSESNKSNNEENVLINTEEGNSSVFANQKLNQANPDKSNELSNKTLNETSGDINQNLSSGSFQSETLAKDGINESLRDKYSKEVQGLLLRAENESDTEVQQSLFEKASLYQQAGSVEKLAQLEKETQKEIEEYNEYEVFVNTAKKQLKKNETTFEALELEQKSYDLFSKAKSQKELAVENSDPLERVNKLNEVREMVAYARMKQKEARDKYIDGSKLENDPAFAYKSFDVVYNSNDKTTEQDVVSSSIRNTEIGSNDLIDDNSNSIDKNVSDVSFVKNKPNEDFIDEDFLNSELENIEKGQGDLKNDLGLMNSNVDVNNTVSDHNNIKENVNNDVIDSGVSNPLLDLNSSQANANKHLSAYERLIKEAEAIEANELLRKDKIDELNFLAKTNRNKSEQVLASVQNISDESVIEKKLIEANAYREQAEGREVEAKKEDYYMQNNLAEAKAKRYEASLILNGEINPDMNPDIVAAEPLNLPDLSYSDEGRGTYANSTNYVKEGLRITPTARYNSRTEIPINVDLPEGLVYKVQIGAFKNKIHPKIFNGISPLTGEQTISGLTRYTAGLFRSFKAADMAKGRIRNLGYNDAFVVVFYNGKRISIDEANTIREVAKSKEKEAYIETEEKEVKDLKKAGIKEEEAYVTTSNRPNPTVTAQPSTVEVNKESSSSSSSLNNVQGVYYTVQVGVYSIPKTSADLFNIKPLNTFNTSAGLIRYSTGVFRTLEEANQRKDQVKTIGVSDAFVVAYKNGQRITIEEAQLGN